MTGEFRAEDGVLRYKGSSRVNLEELTMVHESITNANL